MDSVNYWKKILLQWIKECNFLEKNFYSLDQTEIEVFFMHFKDRFKGDIGRYNNLSSFLKDQYPLFEPHFDDENTLSSGDHIYVYSLLLHFSCVRCPDIFFQENCQKLDELAQRNITDFLQKLLNNEILNKETLRHVIASIQVFTPPNYRFGFNVDSPMKTPRKVTDISPPTPRSCMLQEKNKKVYSLKAQLETLAYEKGVLEGDLKIHQDKIDKLNKELKRSNQEIQDLKNDILSRSKDSGDCETRQSGEEQIRRLSKKISQKEHEIAIQRELIEDLTEQKDCLNAKLKNADQQMKVLQKNISELAEKVDDLSQELEQKEYTIQNLSDANSELEQYINGIRSSTVNSRPDLNMSSEFFDLSRATNSSGSMHSPENLGSVVDIKLREKENENEKLLEEISSIRIDNKKLAKAMNELTAKYSKLFDICNENLIIDDDDDDESLSDPANYFIIFSNCIQSFAKKYEDNCVALNRTKADAKQIEEQNLSQANKLEEIQNQNDELKKENEQLLAANKSLQASKASLENAIAELENKLETCFKERSEETNNFRNLQKEFESLKTEKLDAEHSFERQMETKESLLTKLQLDNANKAKLISDNEQRFEELYQEKQSFEKNIFDLKVAEKHLLEKLDNEKSQRCEFEKQITYLSCELENSKQNYDAVLSDKQYLIENNNQQIDLLKQQIETLSNDQNLKASTILKLETDKESLINNYERRFEGETKKLTELTKKFHRTEAELKACENELQKVTSQLDSRNDVFSKVITYIQHLVTDLKRQLGLGINKTSIQPLLVSSYIEPLDIKLKEEVKCLVDDISSIKNACEHVVKENASLRQKLSELENTIENVREEKSLLEMNVSHLETDRLKQISVMDNLIKSETNLQDQIKVMTSSVEEFKAEILNKTKEAETLSEKQIKAVQLVKELQEQIVRTEVEAEKRGRELENAKVQLEIEITDKNKIKEQLHKTTETINQLQLKISSLETQLAGMKEEASKTSDELSKEFERTKIQLENEVTVKQQMKEELQTVRLQFENLVTEKMKLTEDLENIKLQLETEKTENLKNQQLQTEATQKQQEELQNITLQLETEITKAQSLKKDLANTELQLENEVKTKHKLENELEETKSRLENEISTYRTNLKRAQFELEEDALEKSKITKDFESTKHQLESEVTEKIQIKENLKETNLHLERKTAENQQIKEHLNTIKLQLESKDIEIRKANEVIVNANKALDELRLKVSNLENKYETQNKLTESNKFQLENEAMAKTELRGKLEKATKELKELQTKIVNLEAENEAVNQKANEYNRQLEDVKQQLKNETMEKSSVIEAFENAKKHMNELTNEKVVLENKYQVLVTETDKHRNEVKRLQNKETLLLEEIALLKSTSESQIQTSIKEVNEQKENVSRLIQEIASIRKEKEIAEEEKKTLSKRLESYLNEQTFKETNQRSIEEKLQVAEKEILVKLNLLKTEQIKSQDLENQIKKLHIENAKLRETAGSNMKRIEKQALSLGEYQAKCQKLKKEADIAQNNSEILKSSTEMLQRENSRLNQEYKLLKEKLSKCEKSKDQLESRAQTLEKEIEKLIEEKKTQETSENDLKTSIGNLEKIKHNLEDKIRKLAKSLNDSNVALSRLEQDKVELNLEVGGLNKQLQENKTLLNMKLTEIKTLTSNLMDARNTNSQLMELNEKHQNQAKEIDEENSRLNDQLSKLSLRLKITQEGHETTKTELEDLKSAIEVSKLERDAIEKDHRTAVERLVGIEGLVEERRSTEIELTNKIKLLETLITKLSTDNRNLEELRNKDKLMIDQLNEDILIFKAKLHKSRGICEENDKKWAEEKELLSAEVKESEDRIKETRLELEGKLEKMKNKMKTLYNDEVTKMKKKQEREVAVFKTEIDSLKAKNEKHEAHIKKLSSQIFRLNENILEFQKENTFLKTKLRDFENKPHQLSRVRAASSAATSAQVLSSNLRMEDEEGEIFNNTYLSDLKDGRMSEYFNTDICAQELQYRNSLLPPHLKSTYLAQFDHQMGEDEIRDTPTLDDSSSTLLNTGQRKKVSGATSYKRPGPPTPSKNAGRLSFGGIGELNREILKESLDMASCSSASSKTPAKFKFFSSKLSMRGDERKSYVTNFKKKLLSGGGGTIQCSSTPRKSKAHIDQRRLLDQIMCTASPGPEFSPDCIVKPAVNLPSSLKKLELNRRLSLHKWRQPKLSYASDSGNSDVNSPRMKNVKYVSSGSSKKRTKRSKDRRGSIYLRGSMFARNCRTPTMGIREVFKNKLKAQRNANFNKYRHEGLNEMLVKKASLCSNNWDETFNNNNDDDFFIKEQDMHKNSIEDGNSCGDDYLNNDETSKHFQQLLADKESNAPFEISEINSNPSCYNVNNSSSNVHSRIIYGASVILNRKIPNVNTTMVRKSSIYVKGNDGKSVILVTNQTITLKDLAQMWLQMNISAKSLIAFSFTATLIGIVSFIIQFIYR